MIFPDTGEVSFIDGLRITAHSVMAHVLRTSQLDVVHKRSLPVEGWNQYILGGRPSTFGMFSVEVTVGSEGQIEGVFLKHCHPFYEAGTPDDSERHAFHEGVIAADLRGQQEFPWGYVFCRLDRETNKDWLVVIYSPFCGVPLREREIYRVLFEHESPPG